MLFSGINSRLINPFDGASGESLPDQNNGTSTWSRTNSKLAGKILADCNKSLKHPKIRKHPSASAPLPPGRCRSLTAGVDAGVADRFVFVAGRVFLQFTQDLLHGRLQASGRSGCVWVRLCVLVGGYFKATETVTTSPNAPRWGRWFIPTDRPMMPGPGRQSWWKQEAAVWIRFIKKPAVVTPREETATLTIK